MLKTLTTIALILELTCLPVRAGDLQIPAPASDGTGKIALSTSTGIRLVPNPSTAAPIFCDSILIQADPANAAVVYILNAAPNISMALNGAGTTTVAVLGVPTSATITPPSITIPSNNVGTSAAGGKDMRFWGIQGSTSDHVLATCDLRN